MRNINISISSYQLFNWLVTQVQLEYEICYTLTMVKTKSTNLVAIGGGTGLFALLSGIKKIPQANISAIVTMTDNGGSTGRLRDEFGYLPIGDVRQCIVALAEDNGSNHLLRQMFLYRFSRGTGLQGHNLGNLFLTALTDIVGSDVEAIKQMGKILKINGKVIPVTTKNTNLVAEYDNGEIVVGEDLIDQFDLKSVSKKIHNVYLEPDASISSDAEESILNANNIILGPGDVYTSIVPNLLVNRVPEAIIKSNAKVTYVVNLFSKGGQTYKMNAREHTEIIEHYLNGKKLDHIIINTAPIPDFIKDFYKENEEYVVENDLENDKRVIKADLISSRFIKPTPGDAVKRSIIRHDSDKLKNTIEELINS